MKKVSQEGEGGDGCRGETEKYRARRGLRSCRVGEAAKDATKHVNREEKLRARFYPVRAIEAQPASRNNAMDMRAQTELLIPGVQHTEETDFRAEVPGIASDLEQSFRTAA